MAGLTAALMLSRSYKCTILEATPRLGGRNRTARKKDELVELDPTNGSYRRQTCAFDEGLYLNLGPGRIPYHHYRVIDFCKAHSVELEPYIMETRANLLRHGQAASAGSEEGQTANWLNRRVDNDIRGYLAARLAGYLREGPANEPLLDLLRVFGDLNRQYQYTGSTRSGYEADIGEFPRPTTPLELDSLLGSKFWKMGFYQSLDFFWQVTSFQPVGGMDKIVRGFEKAFASLGPDAPDIRLSSEVTGINVTRENVTVTYRTKEGAELPSSADYCLSNIPLPVLSGMIDRTNLSSGMRTAIQAVPFAPTCKVGWQATKRFWETNTTGRLRSGDIYGGISRTSHNITQLWYPSNGYFSETGTLTGAYNYGDNARHMGDLGIDERLKLAREGASQLHEEFSDDSIVPKNKGLSIAWQHVPFQLGGWAAWDPGDRRHMTAYKRLLQSDEGRFWVIGDQASPLPGWIEGAMMSAEAVVRQIIGGVEWVTDNTDVVVPDTKFLIEGLT